MSTHRWRVGLVATLVLTGIGLVFAAPMLLATATVPLVYVCYGILSKLSSDPQLRTRRTFDPATATPGERVTVTLHVENVGETVLPDVRIVDGVPDLAVVEGVPQAATTLGPGETVTITYSVVPRRGDHEFDAPVVRVRSLSASSVYTEEIAVASGATLTCRTPTRDPFAEAVLRRVGRVPSDATGEGTEFYATREYRRGDPMRRIDWRHVAKTGEFVTVQYRGRQTRQTALVVDVRPPSRRRPVPHYPSGAALSVDIGERLLGVFDRAELAGVGVVGLDPDGPLASVGTVAWAGGGPGEADPAVLLDGVRKVLERADSSGAAVAGVSGPGPANTGGTRSATPADSGVLAAARTDGGPPGSAGRTADSSDDSDLVGDPDRAIERLLGQLPPNAQVILCTPALDDWAVTFGRAATNRGHGLVVVSPDITDTDAVGSRFAGLRRRLRLETLAELGEVVDWSGRHSGDGPLEVM